MSELITEATTDNFKTLIDANVPVLVDFWAPWCGPCKAIAPVLEELATDMADKVNIVKVNVDDVKQVATDYGIRSIPTLMLFKNGEVVETKVGALSKAQLTEMINEHA